MTALSVAKPQADRADPRKILGDFLRQTEFMGEPFFALFTDELDERRLSDITYVSNFVRQKIYARHDYTSEQRNSISSHLHGLSGVVRLWNVIDIKKGKKTSMVWGKKDHGDNQNLVPFVVLNPPEVIKPDSLLRVIDVFRKNSSPLLNDFLSWNYLHHAHERAHVIGANEPQADKIAAVLCRKHFKDSTSVAIMSDIRSLDALRLGARFYASKKFENASINTLINYGYPPVEANDAVLAMPQEKIDAMTDDDIKRLRHERYENPIYQVKSLGKVATQKSFPYLKPNKIGQMILSSHINDIAEGAALLAQKIDASANDPKVGVIAHRFALATKRLAEGAPAYAAVQEQVQKFGSLAPSAR
jgi:hypothetical protein